MSTADMETLVCLCIIIWLLVNVLIFGRLNHPGETQERAWHTVMTLEIVTGYCMPLVPAFVKQIEEVSWRSAWST